MNRLRGDVFQMSATIRPTIMTRDYAMNEQLEEEKNTEEPTQDQVPAHSTEEEKERLRDITKDEIPPGYS